MSLMNKSVFLMTKLYSKNVPVIPRLMQQINRLVFATDVPRSVKIGKGTRFAHSGLGCVIHERTIIGENCKILQNVTMGGRGKHGTPVIGNNVLIGAGATIIGNVKIGDNAKIGAQALVVEDIGENQTIVANKGKILDN
ncbi:serine acetyltransferase [Staphylococcus devriesei]|uniref:Serine acetyltransferase n=1 Tax=Staphylococcus devriesei TaxID=586733 RepID=A0A2T4KG25_9STAP|nr:MULTISPECIES: serine acetyltransferase [Staphylococcus]MCE5090391.1 serine acetyltransferase [Staphylococcus devriesei]MCI2946960.1 serine acetyltransferase [Staphylococcus sp. acrmy]PTE71909.1 serine acetyltransferase [Staphylococcus devriesei]RIL73391.1 serine acetyltransferase [Staphylococcus devriesei]WKU14408.1 serine acetyltransferase [Staphylococcus devriesei]